MIKSFHNKETQALFERVRCYRKWRSFERIALRKLVMVHAAKELKDLACPPNNRLEGLKGDRQSQYSIRINQQYRVCFEWKEGDAYDVEIVDYH
ncbi:type II toxin-antitoxin system RelE/ParE family toxin [Varunaivibrio sulfuroxidans]|uniref:Proteic killer suppression protein n=1 Tax=Varunaivibrio sulfuroxidans TaxID=1773489 RepID=A0A4R3J697_9PROT|nr:type II toxin-antitoxin system RelE/ParE family toxin [Varunaivibrio sulfuroxidans]TCS59960.1 proteic killer suppression protein [Varunaivibrio sulfuroxidans]WES31756.1 type II toxin-antitoxin system RelE/ParE family toxin [Varunaivibrio sulfuroxidans]